MNLSGGQLAELLGGEKDELAKVSFEVTRVNDSMVSSTAALLEQTQSPLVAERLRETAREARITAGWSSLVVNLHPDKREKVKKALEAYSKAEEDRRFDLISARKDMREAMLKRGLPFAGLFTRIRVENLATDQYYHEIKLLETLKLELSEPEIKALVKALDGSDLLHVPPAALDAQPDTVYVLNFVGDTQASGVAALEKEVGFTIFFYARVILLVTIWVYSPSLPFCWSQGGYILTRCPSISYRSPPSLVWPCLPTK